MVTWFLNKISIHQINIDPAPFWANLFFYLFESKYINDGFSKGYKYHGVSRFINDLCAINDGNEFVKLFKNTYFKEFEHQGKCVSFLSLAMKIEDSIFVNKLFDKGDKFLFFIAQMPHISSNIPSKILICSLHSKMHSKN